MTSPATQISPHTFGPWAVVTGASSGIGKEFAWQLAANGLHVVLVARRLPLLEDLGQQLATTFGVRYRTVGVDLAEPDCLATLEAATGDLDVGLLISNAGAFLSGAFLQLDRSRLLRMAHLNALAHLNVSHYFGQRLAARGRGGLLLVASTAGLQGIPSRRSMPPPKALSSTWGRRCMSSSKRWGFMLRSSCPAR